MALSEVQRIEGLTASSSTGSLAYGSNTTKGNLLVGYFATQSTSSSISSITDTQGNVWNYRFQAVGSNNVSLFCYDTICGTGANTVTVNGSFGNNFISIQLFEATSSIGGSWVFDTFKVVGANSGFNATPSTGGMTITQGSEFLCSACVTQATTVTGGTSGWTGEVGTHSTRVWKEYLITGPGTYTANYTISSALDWAAGIGGWYVTGVITFSQRNDNNNGAGTTATCATAYNSNVTAGNLLVVQLFGNSPSYSINSIKDTLGNTYLYEANSSGAANSVQAQTFYAVSAASGANTVTVTLSLNTIIEVTVWEFNVSTGNWLYDQGATANGTAVTATSGNITTLYPAEVLVGYDIINGPGINGFGTGWTGFITGLVNGCGYQIVQSTGTYAFTTTQQGTYVYLGIIASFAAPIASATFVNAAILIKGRPVGGVTPNVRLIQDVTVLI